MAYIDKHSIHANPIDERKYRAWCRPFTPRPAPPQLLCARCGHTWEPQQRILKAGRLPKRCPHCHSPRWNVPYLRKPRRSNE